MINFSVVATAALRACPQILFRWLPGGKLHGVEYDVLNPTRDDHCTGNFRVNIQTGKWADFATNASGGDLVALWAYLQGISQRAAVEEVALQLGMDAWDDRPKRAADVDITPLLETLASAATAGTAATMAATSAAPLKQEAPDANDVTNDPQCVLPVPDTAPPAPMRAGKPTWAYTNAHGELLGYVIRLDRPDGKKEFRPLTFWDQGGWKQKSWPRPAPIYHQHLLAERLEAPVLVVEGEKTADAATTWFEDYVAVTWPGGCARVLHADWRVLAGRRVYLLPDADAPGRKAMAALAETLRGQVVELHLAEIPEGALDEGWDVADAEFSDRAAAKAWLSGLQWLPLKSPVTTQAAHDSDIEGIIEDRLTRELRRANGKTTRYQSVEHAEATLPPWPLPWLNQLETEILARVPFRCAMAARVTTRALLAHLTGRKVISQAGDPTQLYLALVVPSVGEARHYLHVAQALLAQLGLEKTIRSQRLSSPAQIHKALWRQPSLLYLCSEWGQILQFAKRQPAGWIEQALTVISEIWDGHPVVMDADDAGIKTKGKGKDSGSDDAGQVILRAPHLTLLAVLSHDQLATAVKLSEMGRGALEQTQYWILDEDEFEVADPDTQQSGPFPENLVATLRGLAEFNGNASGGNLVGLTGPDLPIDFAVARFADPIAPMLSPLDTLAVPRQARMLAMTARLIARREATALAFARNPADPEIHADDVWLAVTSETIRLGRLMARFQTLSSEDGKPSAYQKVLDFITAEKGKGVGERGLNRGCWPYRNLAGEKREALIKQLLDDGAIVEIQPESKPGARHKALLYVAKSYARAVS